MSYTKYHLFNADLYNGRAEPFENERACYWHELISDYHQQKIAVLGFACDQGVRRNQGRVGAKKAPDVIRQALGKLPVSAAILDKYGTDRASQLAAIIGDMGSIECVDNEQLTPDSLEAAQQAYADKIIEALANDSLAVGLGGGHEIAYATFLGLWQHLQVQEKQQRIGIINFDAHLDIRMADIASSGTPFRQIAEQLAANQQPFNYLCIGASEYGNTAALFDRAKALGVQIIEDDTCWRQPFAAIVQQITDFIDSVDIVYLTIDMDCFSAGIVPGVSATAAKGLSLDFVEQCIEHIMQTYKVKLVDLAEINPDYDRDGLSAKVAARLVANISKQYLMQVDDE